MKRKFIKNGLLLAIILFVGLFNLNVYAEEKEETAEITEAAETVEIAETAEVEENNEGEQENPEENLDEQEELPETVYHGWIYNSGKWYYYDEDGNMLKDWVQIEGSWYYLADDGGMVMGWLYWKQNWYYLKTNGAMATGWVKDNEKWYYLKTNGAMAVGWVKDNGKWYYLNPQGAMAESCWVNQYYVDGSGKWIQGITATEYNRGNGGIGSKIGTKRETVLNWLKKHRNDSYYLGTPYKGMDNRNPKGDCKRAYGKADIAGVYNMNCTGFVWHVLWSGAYFDSNMGYASAYNKIPAMGAGEMGWRTWAVNKKVRYKTYYATSTSQINTLIDAIIQDGFIEPGDVIWTWDKNAVYDSTGMPVGYNEDTHCGIYIGTALGDASKNTWWNSTSNGLFKCGSGNIISRIEPWGPCKEITVIKL